MQGFSEDEELGVFWGIGCCRERKGTKISMHEEACLQFREAGTFRGLTIEESLFVKGFEFHLIGNRVNCISSHYQAEELNDDFVF